MLRVHWARGCLLLFFYFVFMGLRAEPATIQGYNRPAGNASLGIMKNQDPQLKSKYLKFIYQAKQTLFIIFSTLSLSVSLAAECLKRFLGVLLQRKMENNVDRGKKRKAIDESPTLNLKVKAQVFHLFLSYFSLGVFSLYFTLSLWLCLSDPFSQVLGSSLVCLYVCVLVQN